MNKFAKLLSENNIMYEEIAENKVLKNLSIKLKNAYIKGILLSKDLLALYLMVILGVLLTTYEYNTYNDSIFSSILYSIMLSFYVSCLVVMFVLVFVTSAKLYQHREIYYVYNEDKTSEIVNLLKENASKKQYKPNGNEYLLSEIYEAIDRNNKHYINSFYKKVKESDDRVLIIVFERKDLYKSPMLLIPNSFCLLGKQSDIVLRKFIFDDLKK